MNLKLFLIVHFFKVYPFDHQRCPLILDVPFYDTSHISLSLPDFPTTNTLEFLQYKFIDLSVQNTTNSSITVNINLNRIFTHHIFAVFLPTFGLVIIAELTLFVDIGHFEATIMVALTSMLVMYTLYQSIAATLPSTGMSQYAKRSLNKIEKTLTLFYMGFWRYANTWGGGRFDPPLLKARKMIQTW